MFQTIIVGVDGRTQDSEALALARQLGEPDAEILAAKVGVIQTSLLGISATGLEDPVVTGAERDVEALTDANAGIEGVVTSASSVGAGLRQLAEGARADLIVVASSRRGVMGRVFAGDAVRDVLRHAPCPVAVATVGHAATGRLATITVGYDGSPESEAALHQAIALGQRDGAKVGVVAVVEPTVAVVAMTGAYPGNALDDQFEKARADLDRIAAKYELRGVVAVGRAAHELAEASRGSDLLVFGLHNYGLVDRLLIGSTAHALLREQSAPMLITPPEAARRSVADALDTVAATDR